MNRRAVLATIQHHEEVFGSLITNSQVRRRDVMRCVDAGLAKSVGLVVALDGDALPYEPERYREGFALTTKGRRVLRRQPHGGDK